MSLPLLSSIVGNVNLLMWLGISCWCIPASMRVATGRFVRAYDPLRVLILALGVNRVWYGLRPLVFGRHADILSRAEMWWGILAGLFAILCAYRVVTVVRGYERGQ